MRIFKLIFLIYSFLISNIFFSYGKTYKNRNAIQSDIDIKYAKLGKRRLKLDVYYKIPKNKKLKPAIIWIHGGG